MENEYKKQIEVNGIKMEIDLRTAKRIETFKVGDGVKLLTKEYSDTFRSSPGVIVGFDEFQNRPTIIVAYIKSGYSTTELTFAYINKDSKDFEIAALQEFEKKISYNDIMKQFASKISTAEEAVKKIEAERVWFEENYKKYFGTMFSEVGQSVADGVS